MTDQELRALVRDAVARHMGTRAPGTGPSAFQAEPPQSAGRTSVAAHPSHAVYLSIVNNDGACVIEPDVPCNHCNYCKSHGH